MKPCPVCGGVCKGNDVRCAEAYRLQSRAADSQHVHARDVEHRREELHAVDGEDIQSAVQAAIARRGQ